MPVSHLGLAVADLPSSTSFYSIALRPLGYHYIGYQGGSIGFGITEADFFVSQAKDGTVISPTHVAFVAGDTSMVRDCYTNALTAGGRPSGPPDYRNGECSCFNAAVLDLDGNTIEFIVRQPMVIAEKPASRAPSVIEKAALKAPSEYSRHESSRSVAEKVASKAPSEYSRHESSRTIVEKPASKAPTEYSRHESSRSVAEKAASRAPSEYSRHESIRTKEVAEDNPDDCAKTVASRASRVSSRAQTALEVASTASRLTKRQEAPVPIPGISRAHTAPIAPTTELSNHSMAGVLLGAVAGAAVGYAFFHSEHENALDELEFSRSVRSRSRDSGHRSSYSKSAVTPRARSSHPHRNYSVTESHRSTQYPPRSMQRGMRAIGNVAYYETEVPDFKSRHHSSRRSELPRSHTFGPDVSEYHPRSHRSVHDDHMSARRSVTMPIAPSHYIEAPKSATASHRGSRRNSIDESHLKRHDSGISTHSHRSRRKSDAGDRSSTSKVSTVKPYKRTSHHDSALEVPLPASRAPSHISGPTSKYDDGLPPPPTPPALDDDQSDGLDDMRTIVPDDSISCIDFSQPKHRAPSQASRSGGGSRVYPSRRTEAADSDRTARAARPPRSSGGGSEGRRSAMTLPVRTKKEEYYESRSGRRSNYTHA